MSIEWVGIRKGNEDRRSGEPREQLRRDFMKAFRFDTTRREAKEGCPRVNRIHMRKICFELVLYGAYITG